jgi:RHS repeat-associated protein
VRALRASGGADLGGYRYSAFGQTIEDTATANLDQPLRWKGRWFSSVAGGIYDVRARQWSPELGVFFVVDEFREFTSHGTLWSWPLQKPVRLADPSGRDGAGWWIAGGATALALATAAYEYYDIYIRSLDDARHTNLPGPVNGPQDAYRHCVASCYATSKLGSSIAEKLGDAQEWWATDPDPRETQMDETNNAIGRSVCQPNDRWEDCQSKCRSAVDEGALDMLPKEKWN